MKEKEKEKKQQTIRKKNNQCLCFFDKCPNSTFSAARAYPYAKRRILMEDYNEKGMFEDWKLSEQENDFIECVSAMEFFHSICKYPEMFDTNEMPNI